MGGKDVGRSSHSKGWAPGLLQGPWVWRAWNSLEDTKAGILDRLMGIL